MMRLNFMTRFNVDRINMTLFDNLFKMKTKLASISNKQFPDLINYTRKYYDNVEVYYPALKRGLTDEFKPKKKNNKQTRSKY